MSEEISRKLFTVEDCYRMFQVGILREGDRLELIHGEILEMTPIGARHNAAVDAASRALVRLVGDKAIVRTQGSVVLDRFSSPHPDLVLLRPRDDFYVTRNPGGADIFLIIEVADSTLEYDTTAKLALYAIVGIREYWVADLRNHRVLCYSEPVTDKDYYQTVREFHRGDVLAPQLLPDCSLKLDILLP